MRHHHDAVEPSEPVDPVAAEVWKHGLTGAAAGAPLVIHAPHASDLVTADAHADSHADAA